MRVAESILLILIASAMIIGKSCELDQKDKMDAQHFIVQDKVRVDDSTYHYTFKIAKRPHTYTITYSDTADYLIGDTLHLNKILHRR